MQSSPPHSGDGGLSPIPVGLENGKYTTYASNVLSMVSWVGKQLSAKREHSNSEEGLPLLPSNT